MTKEEKDQNFWLSEIDSNDSRKAWVARAHSYYKLYQGRKTDQQSVYAGHDALKDNAYSNSKAITSPGIFSSSNFSNIFFSNTEILSSALLCQLPSLIVKKRYSEASKYSNEFYDTAKEIIERAAQYFVSDIKEELDCFKYDYLITGRGVLWLYVLADIKDGVMGDAMDDAFNNTGGSGVCVGDGGGGGGGGGGDPMQTIKSEKVVVQHIPYDDFYMSSGKKWEDVWFVARRLRINMKSLCERFSGIDIGKLRGDLKEAYDYSFSGFEHYEGPAYASLKHRHINNNKQFEVFEIWDKTEKEVYFVCRDYDGFLEIKEDPYNLRGFFPTPCPLRSISGLENVSEVVPEFDLYKGEARDLETCSRRISNLIKGIQAKTFYPSDFKDFINLTKAAADNDYVPVNIAGVASDYGSLENVFAHEPIEAKQRVIAGLYTEQENLVKKIYEITGISDIMRNVSSPEETATQTVKKGKFGSLRLKKRQEDIDHYIREIYLIIVELVAGLFEPHILEDITQIKLPLYKRNPQYQQVYPQAIQNINMQNVAGGGAAQGMPPYATQLGPEPAASAATANATAATAATAMAATAAGPEIPLLPSPDLNWQDMNEFFNTLLLKDFLFSVETKYDIFEDDLTKQKSRMELLQFFDLEMQKSLPLLCANPEFINVYLSLMNLAVDSFKISSKVKTQIEKSMLELCTRMKREAILAKQSAPPPSPELLLAQAENIKAESARESAMRNANIKVEEFKQSAAKEAREANIAEEELRQNAAKEARRANMAEEEFRQNIVLKARALELEHELRKLELELKMQRERNLQLARAYEMRLKEHELELK